MAVVSATLDPPPSLVRSEAALPAQIIGVGGSVIKSIRADSGASVEIQRQEQTPTSAEHREVKLAGKSECVEAAEKLIW